MEKIFKVRKLLSPLNFGVVSLVRWPQKIQDFQSGMPMRLIANKKSGGSVKWPIRL